MPSPTIASTIKSRGMSTTKPPNPRLRPPVAALLHSRLASDIVFRGEESVEHLACDRSGGAAAAAAVLDDDAKRDARRFGRRERDEQAVVALPLVDVLLAILLILRDADDLSRAGLAGDLVFGAVHLGARRAARLGRHADHGVVHELPVLRRVVLDARQRDRLEVAHLARRAILRADQQTRLETRASGRERRARARKLKRRHEHVALPDAGDDRLARKPDLVRAAREVSFFPFRRRYDAALLARDVEARLRAEAERREPVRQVFDAHRDRELIKIYVARAHDCGVQIHSAVDAAAPFS